MPQWAAWLLGGAGERQGSCGQVGKVHLGGGVLCVPDVRADCAVRGGVKGVRYDYTIRSVEILLLQSQDGHLR